MTNQEQKRLMEIYTESDKRSAVLRELLAKVQFLAAATSKLENQRNQLLAAAKRVHYWMNDLPTEFPKGILFADAFRDICAAIAVAEGRQS